MRPKPKKKTDAELRQKLATTKTRKVERTQTLRSGDFYDISTQFEEFADKWGVPWEQVRVVVSTGWGYPSRLSVKTDETIDEKLRRMRHEADRRYRNSLYKWESDRMKETYRKADEARQAVINGTAAKCCPSNCCCRRS